MQRVSQFLLISIGLVSAACTFMQSNTSNGKVAVQQELNVSVPDRDKEVVVGADRIKIILDKVKGKRVAILGNQTSILSNGTHLVDTLLSHKVNVVKLFTPEHGFRGTADAGATVKDGKDVTTGLPLISLYGKNKKPTSEQLKDIDLVIYDLQDVGVRFFTYISSLEYLIEACAENNKELLILDRPNPLGDKVDGPILDKKYKSFVGMQPIPVVYGMTVGEYAKMLVGEKWVKSSNLKLDIVHLESYIRSSFFKLLVSPSPNLRTGAAIYLYPSMCFFEGTQISLGRGTDKPFQIFGHPDLKSIGTYTFTPRAVVGATNPPLKDKLCYGTLVSETTVEARKLIGDGINLSWLINAYNAFPNKEDFFLKNNFFNLLAGNATLMQQIKDGKTEAEIKTTWQPGLDAFKKIRSKYLIY